VRIPASVCEQLLRHAKETAPEECCGVLLGRPGEILEAFAAENVATDRLRRYQVDPAAHFAAIRRARASGLDVIGAYHSHPRGPEAPSETDRAEAFDDAGFVHLLVTPQTERIAAYCLITGNFVALPLVTLP
jgi:proteasome lid subunit RPN8/RPN11